MTALELGRGYALGPAIVWDGLVDPVLIEGWLSDVEVDARVGGAYRIRWRDERAPRTTDAVIAAMVERESLLLESTESVIGFELREVPGGPRGTSTRLTLRISGERLVATPLAEEVLWRRRLVRLDALLHGHPVDWSAVDGGSSPVE